MTDSVPAPAAGKGIGAPNPGLVTRLVSGLRYAMTGAAPSSWFGPALPPAPAAQQAVGRQFDYPVGFNLRIQPREDSGVSFAELRQIAERWDLLRLVIETRKDQIARLPWTVRPRPARSGGLAASPDDPRLVWLEDFLQDPDREHGWAGWLRMLLEDLFVIDAPTLYLRRDAAGALAALEIVDGATIKRILSPDGRTPFPPEPAYQQVLKGIPAVDYTSGELIYWPRNPRPHRVYGFSPVEQIVMTANIALRRAVSQLNHFTEGNTPEALIGVPEAWTPDQIRQFQEYWDALLQGNLAARRHSRFVPGGLTYQPTREPPLKDDFDEWLARIVCFAFAIPATAFAGQTNRATAETAQAASAAEGLEPLRLWLKDLLDRVIARVLGWPDLEFVWADTTAADPQSQVQLHAAYVAAGIKTRNEVRAAIGLGPIAGGDQATVAGAVSPLPGVGNIAKYTPTELRDWHGRWTTGAGGEAQPAPAPPGPSDGNAQSVADDTAPSDGTGTSGWRGGGRAPRVPVYHNSLIAPAIYDPGFGAARVEDASVYMPTANLRSTARVAETATALAATTALLRNPAALRVAVAAGTAALEAVGEIAAAVTPLGWVLGGTVVIGGGAYYVYHRITSSTQTEPAILPGRPVDGPNLPPLVGFPEPPKLSPLPGLPTERPELPKLTGAPSEARKPQIESYPAQPPKLPNVWQTEDGHSSESKPEADISPEEVAILRSARKKSGGDSDAAAFGRAVHRTYDPGPGFVHEMPIEGARLIPDGLDVAGKRIKELKPDTVRGIRLGKRQMRGYILAANDAYGGNFTGQIDLYDPITGKITRSFSHQ